MEKESISKFVGRKIKFFRKQKGLSLEALAFMINKNKSTLSKYENGAISIDVETLLDISRSLNVDITNFIDYKVDGSSHRVFSSNPFKSNELYLYYYDGRKKNIVKSVLVLLPPNKIGASQKAYFYMDVPSMKEYEKCRFYYIGEMNAFDLVTYLTLLNQTNPMEQLGMCILNSFDINQTASTWGFMFGISYNPVAPFSLKFLLSTRILTNAEINVDDLFITKEELKTLKHYNMMLLNHNQ